MAERVLLAELLIEGEGQHASLGIANGRGGEEDGLDRLALARRDAPPFAGFGNKGVDHRKAGLLKLSNRVSQDDWSRFAAAIALALSAIVTVNCERTKLPVFARPGPFAGSDGSGSASS